MPHLRPRPSLALLATLALAAGSSTPTQPAPSPASSPADTLGTGGVRVRARNLPPAEFASLDDLDDAASAPSAVADVPAGAGPHWVPLPRDCRVLSPVSGLATRGRLLGSREGAPFAWQRATADGGLWYAPHGAGYEDWLWCGAGEDDRRARLLRVRVEPGAGAAPVARDDQVVVDRDGVVHVPVLANDADADAWVGACVEREGRSAEPGGSRIQFRDLARALGVEGVQRIVQTSPNCLFDQYDREVFLWDRGGFCMVEIMSGGAAAGDFDNDGWTDLFYPRMDNHSLLFRNRGFGRGFEDVSAARGLPAESDPVVRSNGAQFLDVDGDGDLDLYVSTIGEARFHLYVNDGTGHFAEDAEARGLANRKRDIFGLPGFRWHAESHARHPDRVARRTRTTGFTIAVGDLDADGFPDVYTTEWFPHVEFLHPSELAEDLDQATTLHTRRLNIPQECTNSRLLRNRGFGHPGHYEEWSGPGNVRTKVGGIQANSFLNPATWRLVESILLELGMENRVDRKKELLRLIPHMQSLVDWKARRDREFEEKYAAKTRERTQQGKRHSAHFAMFPVVGSFEFGAKFADLDLDGFPELIVSGDFGTTQVYWNRGNGSFSRGVFHLIEDELDNSMGCTVGDWNGDGLQDVMFTSIIALGDQLDRLNQAFDGAGFMLNWRGNHLYANLGNRRFEEMTAHAGVRDAGWAWGGSFFDYDNDGDLDLLVVNGMDDPESTDDDFAVNQPSILWRNEGRAQDFQFKSMAASVGLEDRRDNRAMLVFDHDEDGDLDLFIVNHGDHPALYVNEGGSASYDWLRVHVVEPAADDTVAFTAHDQPFSVRWRDSLGARVWVQTFPVADDASADAASSKSNPAAPTKQRTSAGEGAMSNVGDNGTDDGEDEDENWIPSAYQDPVFHSFSDDNPWDSNLFRGRSPKVHIRPEDRLDPPYSSDTVQFREVGSAAAFLAQNEATAHFGLGPGVDVVFRVTVHWPRLNATRTLYGVPTRRTLRVTPPPEAIRQWMIRRGFAQPAPATPGTPTAAAAAVAAAGAMAEPVFAHWLLADAFRNDAQASAATGGASASATTAGLGLAPCESLRIVAITTSPRHGVASLGPIVPRLLASGERRSGALFVNYVPAPGFVGDDLFEYEVEDVQGLRARAWASVRVVEPILVDADHAGDGSGGVRGGEGKGVEGDEGDDGENVLLRGQFTTRGRADL